MNSGVMLMNLTRMREFHWEDYVIPIYKEFKLKITWGDQDIINIIFHYHPRMLFYEIMCILFTFQSPSSKPFFIFQTNCTSIHADLTTGLIIACT